MNKLIKWFKKVFKVIDSHYGEKEPLVKLPESPVDKVLPNDPSWLKTAFKEEGVKEISGLRHNPRIIEYHQITTLKATTDEVPWCSSFVCWVMELSGIGSTRSAAARSWLKWGTALQQPKRGCIAVFSRPPNAQSGHVAFYLYETDSHIVVLGGNQSNEVRVSKYSKSNLLAYKWPRG